MITKTSSNLVEAVATSTGEPTAADPERIWHEGARHLFDRVDARRSGHSYVANRETLVQAAGRLSWHEASEGMSMPYSPGFAVKALAAICGLPQVDRIAWGGEVPTHDDYEGPGAYTVVGIEAAHAQRPCAWWPWTEGPTSCSATSSGGPGSARHGS